jgi:hypothetical protein
VSDVEFYLQRNGVTKMAAKFIVDIESIKFFTGYKDKENVTSGGDFALAEV